MNTYNTHDLEQAACAGDLTRLKEVIRNGPANLYPGMSVVNAAMNGHGEAVRVLADMSGVNMNTRALSKACECGYVEVVKILLPHCDLSIRHCWPLRMAMENNHLDCIDVLVEAMSCEDILQAIDLVFDGSNEGFARVKELYTYKKSTQEHQTIIQQLPGAKIPRGHKKI